MYVYRAKRMDMERHRGWHGVGWGFELTITKKDCSSRLLGKCSVTNANNSTSMFSSVFYFFNSYPELSEWISLWVRLNQLKIINYVFTLNFFWECRCKSCKWLNNINNLTSVYLTFNSVKIFTAEMSRDNIIW